MAWLWWLGGALLLGVAEMFTLNLILLMLAGGALGGTIAAALGASTGWQIVVAAVTALVLMLAIRPWLLRHLRMRMTLVETNSAALVGRPAVVVAPTDERGGRVKLGGEVWSARSTGRPGGFAPGAQVRVTRIDGATVVVEEEPAAGSGAVAGQL